MYSEVGRSGPIWLDLECPEKETNGITSDKKKKMRLWRGQWREHTKSPSMTRSIQIKQKQRDVSVYMNSECSKKWKSFSPAGWTSSIRRSKRVTSKPTNGPCLHKATYWCVEHASNKTPCRTPRFILSLVLFWTLKKKYTSLLVLFYFPFFNGNMQILWSHSQLFAASSYYFLTK